MKNVVVVDVGNTQTVLGLFVDGRLRGRHREDTAVHRSAKEWTAFFARHGVVTGTGSIVSSVVPRGDRRLARGLREASGADPLWVGPRLDTGISIAIPRPSTLGADRLANAAYGFHRYGGPVVLIDFGTATTLCAVSRKGEYLGGAILPGLMVSLEALSARAAKLPRISPRGPRGAIGRSTESAMRIGAVEGHRGAVQRVAASMKEALGAGVRVIATGGLAPLVCRGLPFVERVDRDLTLKALYYIYRRNASSAGRLPPG